MIGRGQPKVRRFSYEPYHYDPKKEAQKKTRITFKRYRSRKTANIRSIFWLVILILMVLYFIYFFTRLIK